MKNKLLALSTLTILCCTNIITPTTARKRLMHTLKTTFGPTVSRTQARHLRKKLKTEAFQARKNYFKQYKTINTTLEVDLNGSFQIKSIFLNNAQISNKIEHAHNTITLNNKLPLDTKTRNDLGDIWWNFVQSKKLQRRAVKKFHDETINRTVAYQTLTPQQRVKTRFFKESVCSNIREKQVLYAFVTSVFGFAFLNLFTK